MNLHVSLKILKILFYKTFHTNTTKIVVTKANANIRPKKKSSSAGGKGPLGVLKIASAFEPFQKIEFFYKIANNGHQLQPSVLAKYIFLRSLPSEGKDGVSL